MNCRPGDLAYIVGTEILVNNGRVVEVIERDKDGFVWDDKPRWIIRCPSRLLGSEGLRNGWGNEGSMPDENLRPIRADDVGEQESESSGIRTATAECTS